MEFKFDGKWESQLIQGTCALLLVSAGLGTNNLIQSILHVICSGFPKRKVKCQNVTSEDGNLQDFASFDLMNDSLCYSKKQLYGKPKYCSNNLIFSVINIILL